MPNNPSERETNLWIRYLLEDLLVRNKEDGVHLKNEGKISRANTWR